MALKRLSEFLFGFLPPSWFLAAAGNTENISKQSLKLAVCILPVKFPVARKLDSHPFAAGESRRISSNLAEKLKCNHQKGAPFHLLKGFINFKKFSVPPGACSL